LGATPSGGARGNKEVAAPSSAGGQILEKLMDWLNWILKFVYLLSLGLWAGTIVFFSFVVARVARQLDPKQTSKFLRAIFPEYYRVQIICGVAATVSAFGLWLVQGELLSRGWVLRNSVLLGAMTVVLIWIRLFVLARMANIRDRIAVFKEQGHEPDKAIATEWDQLHKLTVIVNLAALVIALLLLAGALAALR
jgi:hypothetical protein